ncbi:hypothetical protein GCM10010517_47590 [Streptosporangium fragile]|uniref:Uncharacterized protein n=1 Tax=Streptosporangium fragile TaxID=46186 RepID=A0ABN3W254_9ACTN
MITFKNALVTIAIAVSALAPAAMSAQSAGAATLSDVPVASVQAPSASLTTPPCGKKVPVKRGGKVFKKVVNKVIIIKNSTIDNSVNVRNAKNSRVGGGRAGIGNR